VKVAIIGPGALGCLLAAKFSLSGEKVWLVDYRPERVELLTRQGLLLRTSEGIVTEVRVPAGLAGEVGPVDLAILTVKAHQTAAAAQQLPLLLGHGGLALTLQNGLGNLEEMTKVVGPEHLLGGASILGVTKLREGEVLLAGLGHTYVGPPPGSLVSSAEVEKVAALFRQAGLPCEVRSDIEVMLWEKLLANVGINPLTALLQVKNGVLLNLPPAWQIAVAAATETLAVARAEGINLSVDPETRLAEVCTATAANRSSMLQDITAGRQTEIGALNGQVATRGERHGFPTPVNHLLTQLIRALEMARQDCGGGAGSRRSLALPPITSIFSPSPASPGGRSGRQCVVLL
jgi:2-dehydropantoate 2-reductase